MYKRQIVTSCQMEKFRSARRDGVNDMSPSIDFRYFAEGQTLLFCIIRILGILIRVSGVLIRVSALLIRVSGVLRHAPRRAPRDAIIYTNACASTITRPGRNAIYIYKLFGASRRPHDAPRRDLQDPETRLETPRRDDTTSTRRRLKTSS